MRVLMVTPGFHPIKGGTETMVRNLSVELNRIGVYADIMTFNMDQKWKPKWRGNIEIDGITVFKVPALNWMPIEHSPRFTHQINLIPGRFTNRLKQYDVIHFHEVDFSFPLFSFFVKKPKIFHLHGIDVNYFKRYHLSRLILKQVADLYISITRQMKKELVELGIPEDKIIYLPNSVNTQLFHPQEEKEDNLLLFVGRITFNKGLHVLLESLRYLKKAIRLVIIGPAGEDKYCQKIMELIEKENQGGMHKIEYLGAFNQTDIVKWYQRASIFVAPSLVEAFGIVLLESLACKTPVIATTVGGIPEVVQNHKNSILVPQNNPLKLAEAIQYLLDNKEDRIRMGNEGREWVLENFSLEVAVKRLCCIYDQILASFG